MDRRTFLSTASQAAILLGNSGLNDIFAFPEPWGKTPNPRSIDLAPFISEKLNQQWKELLQWLITNGWLTYFQEECNVNISSFDTFEKNKQISTDTKHHLRFTSIAADIRRAGGFDDFAGSRFIEPGKPQLSLLYHALASPRVRPKQFQQTNYPSIEQLDTLENYIYALNQFDFLPGTKKEDYCLAVFAYEYRPAFKTPHHLHADMVYSRTGIARIGERESNYDPLNRCWTNLPRLTQGTTNKNIAVTPARYGLFLSRKTDYQNIQVLSMGRFKGNGLKRDIYDDSKDHEKLFLQPIRKMFNYDLLSGEETLEFQERHESRKIFQLTNDRSLIRTSADLIEQQRNTTTIGSCFLVISKCSDNASNKGLIRPVKRGNEQVYFMVRKDKKRYFTSYNQHRVEDIELLERDSSSGALNRSPNPYDQGRNLPMYVHIGHRKDPIHPNNFICIPREANGSFEKVIAKGKYEAPLFEDNICEGSVSVNTEDWKKGVFEKLGQRKCIPAFSIVTAPDFFPQVDNFDIMGFDVSPGTNDANESHFFEGGVASLASCRIPPDPTLLPPVILDNVNFNDTYTAVFCSRQTAHFNSERNFGNPGISKGYFVSGYLPDASSSVFAPGWDITFAKDESVNTPVSPFLSTRGLGSPFVEDMKLCAAMNGMWPATSPDASRTFQGSVTVDETYKWLRNPTAIPLTDEEIGIHTSAACTDGAKKGILGWDGEQGPFLEKYKDRWHVNFTDLGRADYVENALHQQMDMSRLRELTSEEVVDRMTCMQKCIRHIRNEFKFNALTDLWLVSMERMDTDNRQAFYAHGVPDNLHGSNRHWARDIRSSINRNENNYLMVFADTRKDKNSSEKNNSWVDEGNSFVKRRRQRCRSIYIYQVSPNSIAELFTTIYS